MAGTHSAYSRRDFLTGVLACGTLTSAAIYLLPGGSQPKDTELTLVTGADSTGARQLLIDMWNRANPRVRVSLATSQGATADQKRQAVTAARNGVADVVNLDAIDIQDFAGQGLLRPIEMHDAELFLDRAIRANRVPGDPDRYWAVPFNTDVGMLFARQEPGDPAEHTLREVLDDAALDGTRAFVGQLDPASSASNEAFVVNILEHALARDEGILDVNGGPAYDLGRWQQALQPLRVAAAKGRVLLSDNEQSSLEAFGEPGRRYMRNWPVQYRVLQQKEDPGVRNARLRVRALPIGILGGQSLAVVAGSRNPGPAADLIRFLTGEEAQKVLAAHGLAPTRTNAYIDPNLKAFIPHLGAIRGAVERSRPRPVHRDYGRFAEAVVLHAGRLLRSNIDLPSKFVDDMRAALGGR